MTADAVCEEVENVPDAKSRVHGPGATLEEASKERREAIDALYAATAIYTAGHVVDQLLDRLNWPGGGRRLVDPSCGDGMFLGRVLERLLRSGHRTLDEVTLSIEGWEIHPVACQQSRSRVSGMLEREGYDREVSRAIATRMVHNRDFLTDGPTAPTYDVVAGNPPYLRWVKVPRLLQDQYLEHVPHYASSDLLHSFLDRSTRAIHPGGAIGLVTADRWLFNSGASRLRQALGRRVSIGHLERLDVNTAFYRAKDRRAGSPPRIHPIAVVLREGADGAEISGRPIFPGVDSRRYEGLPTLGELARVRIAPWLGSPGIFVVNADTARGLPGDCLVPAVDTDDIVDGKLGDPTRYAIRTSPGSQPCAEVMLHLEGLMHRMAARGRRGKPWMPPESFHKMDIPRESLLVPRIATSPKAVRVPAGVLPINHNLSIVCADPERLDQIEAALHSRLAAEWVRDHAPRLEGGYFSLTTRMLRKLPVDCSVS
jgi:hypothetical protein